MAKRNDLTVQRDFFKEAPPDRPPSAKAKRRTVARVDLRRIDVLAICRKIAEWAKKQDADLKDEVLAIFVKHGFKIKRQPENFIGVGGISEGSVQLKKRSAAAGLTEEEIEFLRKHELPVEVVEEVPDRFAVNPDYMDNQELLEKVSSVLNTVPNLPNDFIVRQRPISRTIVTDRTLSEAFEKAKTTKELKEILRICTVTSVHPKLHKSATLGDAVRQLPKLVDEFSSEAEKVLHDESGFLREQLDRAIQEHVAAGETLMQMARHLKATEEGTEVLKRSMSEMKSTRGTTETVPS